MKKWLSSCCIALILFSCDVEGVKEVKNNTEANNRSWHKDSIIEEVDTTNLSKLDFDTVFNFTSKISTDSVVLKSGVQLIHLQKGNGASIKKFDVVALNYRGRLKDGKVFESNEAFGKSIPFVVGLGFTFDAFDEVLQKCRVGDKVRFIIPSEQAYGKKGRGKVIPPDSDLVYEIDITGHVKGEKTASGVEYFSLIENPAGAMPQEGNKVAIAYMAWVKKSGKLFESTAATGKLYEFELGTGRAIKAWHETVAKMHRGEKYLLLVPAEAAYGSKGVAELVPPNSDLIYVIELKDFME